MRHPPRDPEWQNTTVLEGDLAEAVTRLKQEQGKNIMVNGSALTPARRTAPTSCGIVSLTYTPAAD